MFSAVRHWVFWLLFPAYRKYAGVEVHVLQCVGCKRIAIEPKFEQGCPRCGGWTAAWVNPTKLETVLIYAGIR